MTNLLKSVLLATSLVVTAPAMAETYEFGTLLAGSYQPSSTFATLDVTGGDTVYNFTLSAFDLNALFTSGAFLGSIAVNTNPDIKLSGKNADTVTISNISGGVVGVSAVNGGGPTGVWDFRFDLSNGQDRLTANETVSFTATFSQAVTFADPGFTIHAQGLTDAQGGSAWYVPGVSAVPEPETYAMMLAGLGLMGFVARRRKD